MLLTVLAIKLEDGFGASVLYRQVRVGEHGQPFPLLKFRSMREDASVTARPAGPLQNDDRVTRVGRVIRKLRIDELPQILNVLSGQMSLVGPRPERPEFVSQLDRAIPFYAERHTIKPGVTGWAQLCYPYGADERDAAEKLQYDLFYVKNRTLLFYLAILLQTVEVVLCSKGPANFLTLQHSLTFVTPGRARPRVPGPLLHDPAIVPRAWHLRTKTAALTDVLLHGQFVFCQRCAGGAPIPSAPSAQHRAQPRC